MNPLLLLLSLLGVGALSELSSSDDRDAESASSKRGLVGDDGPDEETEETTAPTGDATGGSSTGGSGTDGSGTPLEPVDTTPDAPEQSGESEGDGGGTVPVEASGSVDVIGGRVTSFEAMGEDVTGVRIVSGVEHGNVTVNPDNSMALVMTLSDFTGAQSFTYEATHADGSTSTHKVDLNVVDGPQDAGWGTGEHHYMLATDENDNIVVETGDVHTKVYISGASDALTLADIARIEGINVSDIDGKWLAAHGGYGQSEDMALAEDVGMVLWRFVTPRYSETSNWLLFENGHEYDIEGRIVDRYVSGENELNPVYVGSWGEGDKAVITSPMSVSTESANIVVQGLAFTSGIAMSGGSGNVIYNDVSLTLDGFSATGTYGITIRNSDFTNIYNDTPDEYGHVQGLFGNQNDGMLLENLFLDQNGWHPDHMDPTPYNHNIYLGAENIDVTVRDTISMRAAHQGIMVRSGGFLEDNVAIDNNAGITVLGGDYKDRGPIGNYSLLSDNVVTSAGYKDYFGTVSLGMHNKGELTSLVDNIVAHLADPNSATEFDEKYWTQDGLKNQKDANYYDDTIIWNWAGSRTLSYPKNYEKNYEGLDTDVLDQTTIQLFAEALLGKEGATIEDLAMYLRAQADGTFDDVVDADLIKQFFQTGFGLEADLRTAAETLRFAPSDLGEGVRWDNRLNWSTEDLPGTVDGDSVDLGGNHVLFGGNADIDEMEMGGGATLNVMNGRLDVEGGLTTSKGTGTLEVTNSGQIWTSGHEGDGLDIWVESGRFANTGHLQDADMTVTGGQALLATDDSEFDLGAGHTLSIFDGAAKVGFDGDAGGMAILDMHKGATLSYSATSGDLGSIEEVRSGAFGDAPDIMSGIDLGGVTLEIDLEGLDADAGNAFTLMDSDELVGLIDEATLSIGGLGARDATIVIDYEADAVRLELTSGSGKVDVSTLGSMDDRAASEDALWTLLTSSHDIASDIAPGADADEEFVDAA